MKVPLLDLTTQYSSLKKDLDAAILKVAESQHFILGPEVDAFEKEIAAYIGSKHAIGVSSGTDALLVGLMAYDIGPGDEVIVPDFSFFATAGVVSRLGAKPVFVDVDPVTFNVDPKKLQEARTSRTKAIIPVHLFGQAADMEPVLRIAEGIPVIEDAAQAIGVKYRDGRQVGTIGTIGCFSFFPSKNLGGYGDGGLVTTDDDVLAQKVRDLRVHGMNPKYYHKMIGGNFRLDAIQAAVLRVKLPHLSAWSEGRRKNAALYNRLFVEAGLAQGPGTTSADKKYPVLLPFSVYESSDIPQFPGVPHSFFHIYNQYTIRVANRDALRTYLGERGIGAEVYYPVPFHRQECFQYLKPKAANYPVSAKCSEECLSLPVYPELTDEQIRYVVESIRTGLVG